MPLNATDIEQIKEIWRLSFNDSDAYIDLFFNNMFNDENTLVYHKDGRAVSMYFFLPARTVLNGTAYSTLYLYAAATHPDHRGRGYMAELINEGIARAKAQGADFIALVPANEGLFDYYAPFGFKKAFKKKKLTLSRKVMTALAQKAESCENADLYEIREKALMPYDFLSWGKDVMTYAVLEHEFTQGLKVVSKNGYALYAEGKDTVYVKELCTYGPFSDIAYLLLDATDFNNFVFNLPVKFPLTTETIEILDTGMLKALNEKAQAALNKINNAYIGITLG